MLKLEIDNFEMQVSDYKLQNGAFFFVGTMTVDTIVSEFIPFLSKHQDNPATVKFDAKQYSLYAGNAFYDKFGNIEVSFFTPEVKKSAFEDVGSMVITESDVSYTNLQKMVGLQDKVLRKLFELLPNLKNSPEGTAYLEQFPNIGIWSRQVDNLTDWRNSENGIDFMDGLQLDD
ncbi:hypothetical protein [Levilactobacillus enshiensis]|uniref:hypothetical protein n=1 Tax=Levilactobacillus enshiensis TaxID=2590213 RepID=UPI00117BCAD9|nr:hypothetical protein [Levilactobacillus enshiensis]